MIHGVTGVRGEPATRGALANSSPFLEAAVRAGIHDRSKSFWGLSNHARAKAVSHAIREQVKFPALTVNLEAWAARFTRKFRRVKGSKIL